MRQTLINLNIKFLKTLISFGQTKLKMSKHYELNGSKRYFTKFFIFRLAITRIVLLFLNLVVTFFGNIFLLLSNSKFRTHNVDHIFMWLCERDSLWNFIEQYAVFTDVFSYTNGVWIILFVVTGPQFSEGFKKAYVTNLI